MATVCSEQWQIRCMEKMLEISTLCYVLKQPNGFRSTRTQRSTETICSITCHLVCPGSNIARFVCYELVCHGAYERTETQDIAKDGVHGDHLALIALGEVFCARIILVSSLWSTAVPIHLKTAKISSEEQDSYIVEYKPSAELTKRVIFLSHCYCLHFDSLVYNDEGVYRELWGWTRFAMMVSHPSLQKLCIRTWRFAEKTSRSRVKYWAKVALDTCTG